MFVLLFSTCQGWSLRQMDVKASFLNVVLHEEVHIQQPQGFDVVGKEDLVCKFKKVVYSLK